MTRYIEILQIADNSGFTTPDTSVRDGKYYEIFTGVGGGGVGTVTSVSASDSNGFDFTVANPTTTPAISLAITPTGVLKGSGGAIAQATQGTDYYAPGGTDVAVADGGTGASTAGDARTNLGLVAGGAGDIWVEKAGDSMTGALGITIADTANVVGLTINQNDATNDPLALAVNGPAVSGATKFNSSTLVQFNAATGNNSDWAFNVASNGYPVINLQSTGGTLATPTASSTGGAFKSRIDTYAYNSTPAQKKIASIETALIDGTAASEDSFVAIYTSLAGDLDYMLSVGGTYSGSALNGVSIGNATTAAVVTSAGDQDIILQTGNATTGSITIADGANGDITIAPNGSGTVIVSGSGGIQSSDLHSANATTPTDINIIGGDATSGNNSGAQVNFDAGNGSGSGVGGALAFTAGTGGASGAGGEVQISAGTGGGSSGAGGDVLIQGGDTNTASAGGDVFIYGGDSASGTDGHVVLGNPGAVGIQKIGSTLEAILDAGSIATANKTFTFPNVTGTFSVATTGVGIYKTIYKSADETVNNSDVLQNDDALILPVLANEVWAFTIVCLITSNNTADFKGGWSVPVGTTMKWTEWYDNPMISESGSYSAPTQTDSIVKFVGTIFVGANAGNVNFQWAQATATVVDTKVLTGSYIIAHRLA